MLVRFHSQMLRSAFRVSAAPLPQLGHVGVAPPPPSGPASSPSPASFHSFSTSDSPPLSSLPSAELVPMILERTAFGERAMDIFTRLLQERIICINGPITNEKAASVVAQLIWLEANNPSKPVNVYINSPGGIVTAGLAIYDTMQYIRCPVSTLCMGEASSMGSLLLAAGQDGMRKSLPSARIMLHQPSGGTQGQASTIEIHAKEILRLRSRLNDLYVLHTGQDLKSVENVMDRDFFFSPEEAKEFGLIDEVIERRVKNVEDTSSNE